MGINGGYSPGPTFSNTVRPDVMGGSMGGLGALLGGPLGWGLVGAQALSGLFGGLGQAKSAAEERKQRQRELAQRKYEFNRTATHDEGQTARDVARSLDLAPLRDRAAYLMSARMGMTPQNFQYGDMFKPGSGQLPQPDWQGLAAYNSKYQPGFGGTSGSQNLSRDYLARLGYGGKF